MFADGTRMKTDQRSPREIRVDPCLIRFDPCTIYGGCPGTRASKSVASTNLLQCALFVSRESSAKQLLDVGTVRYLWVESGDALGSRSPQ